MVYVGGLRARLIRDSLFHMVHDSLEALGWFDSGRQHQPIHFLSSGVDNLEEVAINTLAIWDDTTRSFQDELGSNMSEHRWSYWLDFYGEDSALSVHMTQDLRSILEGRMPSIGRIDPNFKVYDYTQATPTEIFTVFVENVEVNRAHGFPKPWQRFWYSLTFDVVDYFGDEGG